MSKTKLSRHISGAPKTRHHSNLRPKQRRSKDFLKAYAPYIPLLVISVLILSILRPWNLTSKNNGVLSYATSMSSSELLRSTNEARSENQLPALKLNKKLNSAAQSKAIDMAKKNYWSHTTPDGKEPWIFINNANYTYKKAGENLAYGFSDPSQVLSGWLNSPSHRENVLDRDYQDIGFGYANSPDFDNNGPATIVVAMYGTSTNSLVGSFTSEVEPANTYTTTLGSKTSEVPVVGISRLQAFAGANSSWMQYALGFMIGAAAVYLVLKHAVGIKKLVHNGEKFVVKHPLFDITLISFIALGILISQQAGVIL